MGAKPFEGAVVVISYVAECLSGLLGYLVEAISFEEMKKAPSEVYLKELCLQVRLIDI
jgi:hypothetical protein